MSKRCIERSKVVSLSRRVLSTASRVDQDSPDLLTLDCIIFI